MLFVLSAAASSSSTFSALLCVASVQQQQQFNIISSIEIENVCCFGNSFVVRLGGSCFWDS